MHLLGRGHAMFVDVLVRLLRIYGASQHRRMLRSGVASFGQTISVRLTERLKLEVMRYPVLHPDRACANVAYIRFCTYLRSCDLFRRVSKQARRLRKVSCCLYKAKTGATLLVVRLPTRNTPRINIAHSAIARAEQNASVNAHTEHHHTHHSLNRKTANQKPQRNSHMLHNATKHAGTHRRKPYHRKKTRASRQNYSSSITTAR